MRHLRCAPLLALSLAITWGASASAQDPSPRLTTVEVLLTATPDLSAAARKTMLGEAAAIWRREGVTLEWLPGGVTRALSPKVMRLLVVAQGRPAASNESPAIVVAELIRSEKTHTAAIASIDVAERIVRDATFGSGPIAVDQHRVGLVLGRAIAHEIGHFLLDTRGHAARGLMRARFDPEEFANPWSAAFRLEPGTELGLAGSVRRDGRTTAVTPRREAVGVSPGQ